MNKNTLIKNICAIVLAVVCFVLVSNAKVSFHDSKKESNELVPAFSFLEYKDTVKDYKEMAAELKEQSGQRIEGNPEFNSKMSDIQNKCSIAITLFTVGTVLYYCAFVILIFSALSAVIDIIASLLGRSNGKWNAMTAIAFFPFLAFICTFIASFAFSNVYQISAGNEAMVSFSFVSGVNYIFTALGILVAGTVASIVINMCARSATAKK